MKKSVKITKKSLKHSSRGDFSYQKRKPVKMKGGGHGEENIEYLDKNNLEHEVGVEYTNGVRLGSVKKHYRKKERTGTNHAWFPETWTRTDIKKAGEYVSNLKKNSNPVDGKMYTGRYRGVTVGVIYRNGKVGTICPYFNVNAGARRKTYAKRDNKSSKSNG